MTVPFAPDDFDPDALKRARFENVPPDSGIAGAIAREREATTDNDVGFVRGGDNTEFFQETEADPASIVFNLRSSITKELETQGAALGWSAEAMREVWQFNWRGALKFVDGLFREADTTQTNAEQRFGQGVLGPEDGIQGLGSGFYSTGQGFNQLVLAVWDYYRQNTNLGLGGFGNVRTPKKGGGGRRGPTSQEIRDQFDLDELSRAATEIWRRELLEEPDNARAMARAYVDAVVAGKGQKKVDFESFILNRTEQTDRWASIYRDKPESMSTQNFLQPYFAAAQQVAQPSNAADIAIGGAQFGASASTFAQRLRRTDEATGSAPFIQELQGRLSGLKGVLKG